MTSKLLIVSANTRGKEYFTQNTLPGIFCIEAEPKDTADIINAKLLGMDLSGVTNIGIVYDNNTAGHIPFMCYTVEELQQQKDLDAALLQKAAEAKAIADAEAAITVTEPVTETITIDATHKFANFVDTTNDTTNNTTSQSKYDDTPRCITPAFYLSNDSFSTDFLSFIVDIQSKSALTAIDVISCNFQHHSQFDELESKGITVRYSTNITGTGGDWILESHNVNVTPVYFTDAVRSYPYKLGGVVPTFNSTSGYYEIADADNLYWLMTQSSNTGPVPNLSSSFQLTADIDMTNVSGGSAGSPAQSIGGSGSASTLTSNYFTGNLFGANKTVNLRDLDSTLFTGFIGNFGRDNDTDTQDISTCNNLTIVYNSGTMTFSSVLTSYSVGLLAGVLLTGTLNNCTINTNTDISITVSLSTSASPNNNIYIGGLVGFKRFNSVAIGCSITNSTSKNISITTTLYKCTAYVGGMFGRINTPKLASTDNKTINNCNINLNGNLSITNTYDLSDLCNAYLGGYVGITELGNTGNDRTYMNSCNAIYNNCTIKTTLPDQTAGTGAYQFCAAGGFAGSFNNAITVNLCNITITTDLTIEYIDSTTTAGVTGQYRQILAGGFAGQVYAGDSSTAVTTTITDCKSILNNFNVNATNQQAVQIFNECGGYIGRIARNTLGSLNISSVTLGTTPNLIITGTLTYTVNSTYIITNGNNNTNSIFGGIIALASCTSATIESINATINAINIPNSNTLYLISGGYVGRIASQSTFKNGSAIIGSFTISNTLQSNNSNYYGGTVGFIGSNATINNIDMTITTISMSANAVYFNNIIGGLVGLYNNGNCSITNCNTTIGSNASYNLPVDSNVSGGGAAFGGLIGYSFVGTTNITNNTIQFGNNLSLLSNAAALAGIYSVSISSIPPSNVAYFINTSTPLIIQGDFTDPTTYSVNGAIYPLDGVTRTNTNSSYLLSITNANIVVNQATAQLVTINAITSANQTNYTNAINALTTINGQTINFASLYVGVEGATPLKNLTGDTQLTAQALICDQIFTARPLLTKFLVTRDQLGLPQLSGGSITDTVLVVRPSATSNDVTAYVQGNTPRSGNPYALLSNIGDQVVLSYTKFFTPTTLTVTRTASGTYNVLSGATNVNLAVGENVTVNSVLTTIGSASFSATASECLLKGTKLLTDSGYRLVEDLKMNDVLITADGKETQITQVLKRDIFPTGLHQPYIVRKGTYGAVEDLYISPNHAILVDGKYIAAKDLDLDRAEIKEMLVYYHFSITDMAKDAIIANGVPVETLYGNKHLKV